MRMRQSLPSLSARFLLSCVCLPEVLAAQAALSSSIFTLVMVFGVDVVRSQLTFTRTPLPRSGLGLIKKQRFLSRRCRWR